MRNKLLSLNASGAGVAQLHTQLQKLGFQLPLAEVANKKFGTATQKAVKTFQKQNKLPVTGKVSAKTAAKLSTLTATDSPRITPIAPVIGPVSPVSPGPVSPPVVNPIGPGPGPAPAMSTVQGTLVFDNGLPPTGITVRIYDIGFGGQAVKIGETNTGPQGNYVISYSPPTGSVNLQVRVVDSTGNEVTISSTRFGAQPQETLNLIVPSSVQAIAPEFQRLSADMQTAIGGVQNLSKAQETDSQQDLTMLSQSTRWDGRLLATAARAAQLTTITGLTQDVLYALFRAGLPTDPQILALVPPATISAALTTASQSGIVNLSASQIAAAQSTFTTYAIKTNLSLKVAGAPSSYNDLLGKVLTDPNQQLAFAGVFFDPTISQDDLWAKAAASGISDANISVLKLQGKLAVLTVGNADLVNTIQQTLGPNGDPSALVDKDYHLPATWANTINSIAGNDVNKLASLIPDSYGGAATADRLQAYAADLARKVRVTFPTRVVARLAETGSLNLDANDAPKVGAFLKAADSAGYQLGRTPLNRFLKNLPQSVPAPDAPTVALAKTLHRLYQITPSNESLQAAVKLGFNSARDIIAHRPEEFSKRFGSTFPSASEANLVYRKAQQVAGATFNLFAAAKQLDVQPPIFALSSSPAARQSARDAISRQFPSMAGLFGSLDFCECEDCRSVLSPAAYFVDALHFLDPDPGEWQSTLTAWQNSHNNERYPFGSPFSALTARRPDLPNLNLSCENTNTLLPYIDIANEILEYFVANQGSLQNLAHDTRGANSADLIAEPQNILPAAYSVLANRIAATPVLYPLGLPFDLWIETVRGLLNYFQLPLRKVLEVFRPADSLELLTDANNYPYYQSSIFFEGLRLSPADVALLTDPNLLSVDWFKLYGYTDQPTALSELASAETLAATLGITYQNLADIMETGFVNPSLVPLTIPLRKFGLSLNGVFSYTGQPGYSSPPLTPSQKTTFEKNLQTLVGQYYPESDPKSLQNWLNSTLTAGYSNRVLVLKAPSTNACDFQHTVFQYASGTAAGSLDLLKLNLFVRIWKKLGWSIDETDRALQLFLTPLLPRATDPNLGPSLSKAIQTALIYVAHLQTLFGDLQSGTYGRIGILPIWSSIPTTGRNPLYAQLFLTDAVLNNDPIFDNPTGQYLCYFDSIQGKYLPFRWQSTQSAEDVANGYVLLGNHIATIQGALRLAADDVESVLNDNQMDLASAPLTLGNLSLLYRYAVLSQGLKLSVSDLIALKQMCVDLINTPPLSEVNPFDSLSAAPLDVLRNDHLWVETVQFSKQAAKVTASGFFVQDLQYILRHQIADPAGPYNQDPAVVMQQIRSLAAIIRTIQGQTAIPSDITTFTDDLIRQKISQVFPAKVVQTFMGMWTGTIRYTATPVSSASAIPSTVFHDQPSIQLVYDEVESTQTIVYQGVLTSSFLSTLIAKLGTLVTNGTITSAQETLLQGLLNDIHTQAQTFFQIYLQHSTIGNQQTGFLQPGDLDTLFTPPETQAARATFAAAFLPYLQDQLIGEAVIQSVVTQLGANALLIKALLTNTAIASDPTQPAAPPSPLLAAFQVAGDTGVTITYFAGSLEEPTTAVGSVNVSTANTDNITNPTKPASVNSARIEGYLEVPTDGPYNFTAILPNNAASVALKFDFMGTPLAMSAQTPTGSPLIYPYSCYTQLKAGVPCHFVLDFQDLAGGDARLLVQAETLPQGPLSQLTLYPEASVERYNRAQILLAKIWQLVQGFNLDETDITYIASHSADFGNISFSSLPTQASDDSLAGAQKLFGQFLRLANYADLKQGPAGGTDGLIDVFQNARQTIPLTPLPAGVTSALQLASQNLFQAIADLTRRDAATIQDVVTQLWGTSAIQTSTVGGGAQTQLQFTVVPLVNDLGFRRLWQALQMVQTLGAEPRVLKQITGLAYPSRATFTTNQDPGVIIASALRNTIKAQYSPDQWRPIAQSVFDPLRQKKRDALCAYILTLPAIKQFGAVDTNGLFEFFLVDPGMEPVVQTSRIRLALSSVQTFVERCLLNLEPQVRPSIIDSNRWDWMKRYRVWQANREIFLWPENWLIPEFRENATDLFQALQSTLLQGDITQDLVEQAFIQYLQDLDVRARLDIVSMFNQPPPAGDLPSSNILHVIGRNHGKPAKYFYRTYANGIWSGWIPVTPDIEGDHILAVVWRGRLNLFWLTFLVQGAANPKTGFGTAATPGGSTGATPLTSDSFDDISTMLAATKPVKTVQIQLHWSEYYQGKWSPRKSSDINRFEPVSVSDGFDPVTDVYVHVSIDTDDNGDETAVRIHMDGLGAGSSVSGPGMAFRLTGKNSEPTCSRAYWQGRYYVPYVTSEWDATKGVLGGTVFENSYTEAITVANGVVQGSQFSQKDILQSITSSDLLLCNNLPPINWFDAWAFFKGQIEALSSPLFYEDTSDVNTNQELTFFVQPSLAETSFTHWSGWAINPPYPAQATNTGYLKALSLVPQVPNPRPLGSLAPEAVFQYRSNVDWMTDDATLLSYGKSLIGKQGGVDGAQISSNGSRSQFKANPITAAGGVREIISGSGLDYAAAVSLSRLNNRDIATSGQP